MLNTARMIEVTNKVTSVFSFVGYLNFILEFTPNIVKEMLTEISTLRKALRAKQRFYRTMMGFDITKKELDILIENINNAHKELDKFPSEHLNNIRFQLDTERIEIKIFYDINKPKEQYETNV